MNAWDATAYALSLLQRTMVDLEREVARISQENARLGRKNDEACDRIFELEQMLSDRAVGDGGKR